MGERGGGLQVLTSIYVIGETPNRDRERLDEMLSELFLSTIS